MSRGNVLQIKNLLTRSHVQLWNRQSEERDRTDLTFVGCFTWMGLHALFVVNKLLCVIFVFWDIHGSVNKLALSQAHALCC